MDNDLQRSLGRRLRWRRHVRKVSSFTLRSIFSEVFELDLALDADRNALNIGTEASELQSRPRPTASTLSLIEGHNRHAGSCSSPSRPSEGQCPRIPADLRPLRFGRDRQANRKSEEGTRESDPSQELRPYGLNSPQARGDHPFAFWRRMVGADCTSLAQLSCEGVSVGEGTARADAWGDALAAVHSADTRQVRTAPNRGCRDWLRCHRSCRQERSLIY